MSLVAGPEEWAIAAHSNQRFLICNGHPHVFPGLPVADDMKDREALLLPIAAQMVLALRTARVCIGDSVPVFGEGLRTRLIALAAEQIGAVANPRTACDSGAARAAIVTQPRNAFLEAACKRVRRGGIVVLAAASAWKPEQFHFYVNLQATRASLIGVPCDAGVLEQDAWIAGEARRLAQLFWSRGETLPVVSGRPDSGSGEFLISST